MTDLLRFVGSVSFVENRWWMVPYNLEQDHLIWPPIDGGIMEEPNWFRVKGEFAIGDVLVAERVVRSVSGSLVPDRKWKVRTACWSQCTAECSPDGHSPRCSHTSAFAKPCSKCQGTLSFWAEPPS